MSIINFWKSNRQFWITIDPKKQKEADEIITKTFLTKNLSEENLIGKIIFLDQFSRHFQRIGAISEEELILRRSEAINLVQNNISELEGFDEVEIVFALMPFKHAKKYDFIFEYLHTTWLKANLTEYPLLHRFYMDTYKKAFVQENVIPFLASEINPYSPERICDFYPETLLTLDTEVTKEEETLLTLLHTIKKRVVVSLSGGVDSMVMLTLLKKKGAEPLAVHIVYGNRTESEDEYNFLADFCGRLGVPLYVYRIKWIRRGYTEREFYEEMTRELRFFTYKAIGDYPILLGHIKDDIVENIWTNIANCNHLDNLKKMESEELQNGVYIMRPFLTAEKKDIYKVSETLRIPYLKNTTPSWSNRGKFREHFHTAVVKQYGSGVDDRIIEFAETIQIQNKLLSTLLYDPIYKSFKDNKVDITGAINAKIDVNSWLKIFETICYKYLNTSRPSINSVKNFCNRLLTLDKRIKVDMGKKISVNIVKECNRVSMEFILSE